LITKDVPEPLVSNIDDNSDTSSSVQEKNTADHSQSSFNHTTVSDRLNSNQPEVTVTFSVAAPSRYVGDSVCKLFGTEYFNGEVTAYNPDTDWYRIIYEDGDSEDVELNEVKRLRIMHAYKKAVENK